MRALGLTDGSAGMIAQVKALGEALQIPVELQQVTISPLWRYLPNALYDWPFFRWLPIGKNAITPDQYELIISCGRRAALVVAALKTRARKINIQDPQLSPKHFDLVIAMKHDRMSAPNVISPPLALHAIKLDELAQEALRWQDRLAVYAKPYSSVLLGGSTNKYRFGRHAVAALLVRLEQELAYHPGSLLITISRRTGKNNIKRLVRHFKNNSRVFLYGGGGENPYLALLGLADRILVTNDSVNMLSEAFATGKPVEIIELLGHNNTKPAEFAAELNSIKVDPFRMMEDLAKTVRERLSL